LRWLLVAEHELLLFATFWFIISAIDEAAIDLSWIWLRLGGRARPACRWHWQNRHYLAGQRFWWRPGTRMR
jgi:hypothetical protein